MEPNDVTAQIVDAAFKIHVARGPGLLETVCEVVAESVIVETKSMERNHPVHVKQWRTHLVLAKLPLGLVLNFGLERMKDGITRIVNGLP